jgi:hypothetical protein
MLKITVTHKKILFVLVLIILNLVGSFLISMVFLGSPNANGEGAPVRTEFISFLHMFVYVLAVSISISFIGLLLTRIFRSILSFDKVYIRRIFWFELLFLLIVFFLPFLYIYYLR